MKEIQATELAKKLNNGEKVNIIDVREDNEVAQGIIPGAKHIRLGEIPDRLEEFNKSEHYYMVCRSGARSGRATEYLEANGIEATNMEGGMLAWEEETDIPE
ncbi:rhodanese-like domain-containing protein [Gracilibacillus salitolerans]|uniref:Rhodanese-like domain-containing protein n=1 Tax=Gracilibacillus salitolerans TaxID=2663022 RepID=A0A5Q2TRM2_9BACI|nr:rhodanese-like domain-containing protein [Gracilibacillus salitolerans]QGH35438.1 rhodanese-like domain-containing protein [Gracilibacillus salitolerans]